MLNFLWWRMQQIYLRKFFMERNISILIANENFEETNEIIKKLANEKTVIDSVANGKTAIEKILNKNYDLLICDLVLPEVDGFEVIDARGNPL